MKIKFEWENIKDLTGYKTWRAKVIGGWVLSSDGYLDGEMKTSCMIFIPDPEHKWEVEYV